jgi:hypothetical protein
MEANFWNTTITALQRDNADRRSLAEATDCELDAGLLSPSSERHTRFLHEDPLRGPLAASRSADKLGERRGIVARWSKRLADPIGDESRPCVERQREREADLSGLADVGQQQCSEVTVLVACILEYADADCLEKQLTQELRDIEHLKLKRRSE